MGILTYQLDDGDLTQFQSSKSEDVHLIKIEGNRYALDTMSYGEFLDKKSFENAKKTLQTAVSAFSNIEVKSDNEISLYLSTEVLIDQSMSNDDEFKILNDASNLLKEAFDEAAAFWKLTKKV